MKRIQSFIKEYENPLLIAAGAALLTILLMSFEFDLIESNLYDFRMRRGSQPKPSDDIVLVSLDDQTSRGLDEFLPLGLDKHVQFLEALESFNPRAVGYLVDMNQVSQNNPELFKKDWGKRFVTAAERLQSKGIPVLLGTPFDVTGEVLPPYPLSSLNHGLAVIHKDGNVFAEDKVTRRALVKLNDKPAFHLKMKELLNPGTALVPSVRGTFNEPQIDADYFFFRYYGDPSRNQQSKHHSYKMVSFIDIILGKVPKEVLAGKIVLIGSVSKEDSNDFAFTPYSKNPFTNSKLVIHAIILDNVLHGDGIVRSPDFVIWIETFLASSFVIWSVFNYTPLYGVFNTISLALLIMVIGQLLFSLKGIWLHESQPLIGIFVGYYLAVPYRLIREYKKRWDYQRKNELLVQVEELKTNFLSLVTHDLKTPVARIQGLAEVLLRKSSTRLLDADKETLAHIIGSTEELNRFITSILELTKVESNRLQLKFESKDINQLIERSIESFQTQARIGQLRITAKLEPLFPIKIDPSLISKVINNLIDNALKYSPKNSEIFIESKESGDWVEISIQDQGIGMTLEEKANLFTRFYRAKNDTTTQVAGTGLGLYLTKYFIEAHAGRVEVESEKGLGSTFRIFLPLLAAGSQTSANVPSGLTKEMANNDVGHTKEKVNV